MFRFCTLREYSVRVCSGMRVWIDEGTVYAMNWPYKLDLVLATSHRRV